MCRKMKCYRHQSRRNYTNCDCVDGVDGVVVLIVGCHCVLIFCLSREVDIIVKVEERCYLDERIGNLF